LKSSGICRRVDWKVVKDGRCHQFYWFYWVVSVEATCTSGTSVIVFQEAHSRNPEVLDLQLFFCCLHFRGEYSLFIMLKPNRTMSLET
jgi:hypothetical protein